ncbi:hypothetical protein L195_g048076, partial [Trifolium pratense]
MRSLRLDSSSRILNTILVASSSTMRNSPLNYAAAINNNWLLVYLSVIVRVVRFLFPLLCSVFLFLRFVLTMEATLENLNLGEEEVLNFELEESETEQDD